MMWPRSLPWVARSRKRGFEPVAVHAVEGGPVRDRPPGAVEKLALVVEGVVEVEEDRGDHRAPTPSRVGTGAASGSAGS